MGLDNDRFRLESCRLVINVANHKYPGRGVTGVISFGINRVKRYCTVFMGKSCGRRKVVPKVSPGKTLEGLMGGVITIMIASLIIGPLLTPLNTLQALLAGLLIGISGFAAMS